MRSPVGEKPNSSVSPMVCPRLHAAAGHPQREGVDVVIAADLVRIADLAHRRAPEFAAPDDQRVVQQSALLQVADQRGRGLVDFASYLIERLAEVGVMVPIGVIELHEAHAALHQAARQQAVVRVAGLARLGAVHLERLFATPSRNRSARARWSASGTPSHTPRCAWRSPGRPIATSPSRFRSRIASMVSSCASGEMPAGLERSRIGSPPERNGTPW